MSMHPICYDIYPVRLWKTGDIVEDNFWLPVPRGIESGKYWISVKPFERLTESKYSSDYSESILAVIEVR